MSRFSPTVADVLLEAGWYPGRHADELVDRWEQQLAREGAFVMSSPARAALREFGGLRIDQGGPGIDLARSPFTIDPLLALGSDKEFRKYAHAVGKTALLPLGELADEAFLAIADTGEVYLIFEGILLVGKSIDDALENLVEGRAVPGATWLEV